MGLHEPVGLYGIICHHKCMGYLKFGERSLLQLVSLPNKSSQTGGVNNNRYFIMLTASGVRNSDKAQ